MIKIFENPSVIKAAGTGGKVIKEYFGRVNSNTADVSIAHMNSPEGWEEPGQCPEFDEYTVVLKGALEIRTNSGVHVVREGQGIITGRGEWVKYSSPFKGGAEYIAVCLPAFSPGLVHRDS